MVYRGDRGCRSGHGGALRPLCWEEEGAVVGVLVQVGVSPAWTNYLGGWV